MKIVHVLTRLLRAGSEENTLLNCAGQIAAGHEVVLIHGNDHLPGYADTIAPGIRLVEVKSLVRELRPLADAMAYLGLRRVLTALKPDIVHTHQSKAGFLGRLAAAAARVPVIVHGVHILPFLGETGAKKAMYVRAEFAAARETHAFIHVSDGMRAACAAHGIGAKAPHYVVRSGFDIHRFARARPPDDWRAILRLSADEPRPPVVGMLAVLEPRKRHLALIDNISALFRQCPDARVLLAGDGGLRSALESRIAALGLADRVILLGHRSDPERVIALSDVCIHCSSLEGLPRSVIQYTAAGRPVVMFDLPGIDEIVVSGVNGVVVRQDDWGALLGATVRLLKSPEERSAFGERARLTRVEAWDAASMSRQTLDIYRLLVEGKREAAA